MPSGVCRVVSDLAVRSIMLVRVVVSVLHSWSGLWRCPVMGRGDLGWCAVCVV